MNIVITGGASGLGEALARHYAAAGHRILVLDRDRERMAGFDEDRYIITRHADFSDAAGVAAAISAISDFGPADLVFQCAGISATGPFEEISPDLHERVIAVNFSAPILIAKALIKEDLIAVGGALVFIGSLSSVVGYPGAASYAATKDGLLSYARSLAPVMAERGRRCHIVLPGPLKTPHAARYAPEGSSDRNRLDPARAAEEIARSLARSKLVIVPGFAARLTAFLGRRFPALLEKLVFRALYLPLKEEKSQNMSEKQ